MEHYSADGTLWADSAELAEDGQLWESAPGVAAPTGAGNTDLADVPPQWIDQNTIGEAGALQAEADAGMLPVDSDGDGVTDAGEFVADTDPLDADDVRTLGLTEDYDPALGGDPELNRPAII